MGRKGVVAVSCSGLHCAGCGGGSAAPVLAFAAFCGADWVVTHLAEVLVTSAACGALAAAAVVALMRWAERRDARHAIERPLLTVREAPACGTRVPDPLTSAGRPTLPSREPQAVQGAPAPAPAIENHFHFHGADSEQYAARVIRQALAGPDAHAAAAIARLPGAGP